LTNEPAGLYCAKRTYHELWGATNDAIPEERWSTRHLERGHPRPHSDCSLGARNNSKYQAEEQAKDQAKSRQVSPCYAGRTPRISWNFRVENRRENFSRKKTGAVSTRASRCRRK
jgi:hypothetical protein